MKLDLTDGDMAEIQVQGAKLLIHTDYRGFVRVTMLADEGHDWTVPEIWQSGEHVQRVETKVHRVKVSAS